MNKKIAIGRQGPKPCVVVGMDRASATRVKWEFMKDSKGMFDTHQLSLGTPNFDKLRLELLFRSSLTETPTFRFSFLLPHILYRRPSRGSRTPSREALQSPNVRVGNVFERNELGSQHDYGLRCPCQYMRICANARSSGRLDANLIAETAVGLLEMRSEFLSVDIPFSSYHSSTLGADRTGATK
jgi:hypothetical protein